jgi:hypothetical protein
MLVLWAQLGVYTVTDPNSQQQIEDYVSSTELAFTVYNSATGTFSTSTKITDNNLIDMTPFLAPIPNGNQAFLLWGQASDIAADVTARKIALQYSVFDGTSFFAEGSVGTNVSQCMYLIIFMRIIHRLLADLLAIGASETHAVLLYTRQINVKTTFGYIETYELSTQAWSNDIQTFHFDVAQAMNHMVVSPAITYRGNNEFLIMWIAGGDVCPFPLFQNSSKSQIKVMYRTWSPVWSVSYMQTSYPIIIAQDPQGNTSNPTMLVLGTQVRIIYYLIFLTYLF